MRMIESQLSSSLGCENQSSLQIRLMIPKRVEIILVVDTHQIQMDDQMNTD